VFPESKHVISYPEGLSGNMSAVKTEGYTRVASTDEMPPGITRKVTVEAGDVLLANVDGNYYAIGNTCTHEEGPLDEGHLFGYEVECPWHGSHFDLRTGEAKLGPADRPEPRYEVRVEGKDILIKAV
jgi:nitrite reductase/ring-hydroxylating ferredoxin subunit